MLIRMRYRRLFAGALIFLGCSVAFSDTNPPELIEFDFSPQTVDLSTGPQSITVTARITDDVSGLAYGYISFSDSTDPFMGGGWSSYVDFSDWTRISGDAIDGVYRYEMDVSSGIQNGVYSISDIHLQDTANNYTNSYGSDAESYMSDRGFPYQFTVSGSTPDTQSPELVEFDFSPKTLDLSEGSQSITVTARITDDVSGLEYGYISFSNSTDPFMGGGWNSYVDFSDWTRISGDAIDGVYRYEMDVPSGIENGVYSIANINITDAAYNSTSFYGSEAESYMSDRGFLYQFTVSGSTPDTQAPELVEFDFSPKIVDLYAYPQS